MQALVSGTTTRRSAFLASAPSNGATHPRLHQPPFAVPANLQQPTGFLEHSRVRNTEYDSATRTMLQVDVSHYMRFLGGHDFKVGFGRMKNVNKVQEGYPGGGYISLWWDSAFPNP